MLALHDGVDADPARMAALCTALRGHVDLVLGGHTLRCFAGELAGVPFLQPWGFGSQLGVADLRDDGGVALRLVDPGPPEPWTGPGAGAQAALEDEVVGRLAAPLRLGAGGEDGLARAVAAGVLAADDRLGRVLVGDGDLWNQPARDGVGAFLPAGAVSLAQVLRLTPFTGGRSVWGGRMVAAELAPARGGRGRGRDRPGGRRGRPARRCAGGHDVRRRARRATARPLARLAPGRRDAAMRPARGRRPLTPGRRSSSPGEFVLFTTSR